MKVICIDDADRPGQLPGPSNWYVQEGCVYTAIDDFISEDNFHCYSLLEDPDNEDYGFEVDRFIPLSNIDEIELAEQRKELIEI